MYILLTETVKKLYCKWPKQYIVHSGGYYLTPRKINTSN